MFDLVLYYKIMGLCILYLSVVIPIYYWGYIIDEKCQL